MTVESGVRMRRRGWLLVSALALLGCGQPDDPQAALDATVQRLQDALEAKDTDAVLELLDAKFRAQSGESEGLDREWARKTMGLMFLRYQQVKVIAVTRSSRVDAAGGQTGRTEAQVLVTGAQGLIPERAVPYAVQLEWWREGGDWKLRDLRWE
jgi:hypothetical protein